MRIVNKRALFCYKNFPTKGRKEGRKEEEEEEEEEEN
jgi:hypothetical protein